MRRLGLICFVLVAAFLLCRPLWPKFGIIKTTVRFAIFHPPAFHAYGHQMRVEVDSADRRAGSAMAPRIQRRLEEGLSRQGFNLTPNARTLLLVSLTDSTAALTPTVRSEVVNVHVGEHNETDKDGNTKQVEDCKEQTSLVTYLISSGHLALDVKAKDTQTQSVVMSQTVERSYHHESAIAGPRRCNGAAYNLPVGQLQQDPLSILGPLGDDAASEVLALATGHDETREVLLAVDGELKRGNAQALAGDWKDALDTWTNASPRSRATQAARQYNLGVGHEVMAATAMHNWQLDDATSHLDQSQECYAQALKLTPKEEYFRNTMSRVQADRQLLQQQLEQASEEGSPGQGADPRPTAPAASASSALPLEGWPAGEPGPVHDYRVYVRTRLSPQKGQPAETLKQELLADAADYGVESNAALRVLDSETHRLALARQNMEKYREDFRAATTDGTISADARQMLRKRQQILHLSDEQVKEIEAQFKFQETD
jgi:hypothetical protein